MVGWLVVLFLEGVLYRIYEILGRDGSMFEQVDTLLLGLLLMLLLISFHWFILFPSVGSFSLNTLYELSERTLTPLDLAYYYLSLFKVFPLLFVIDKFVLYWLLETIEILVFFPN